MAAMFFARADERSGRGWRRGGRVRRRSTTPTRRGGGAGTRPSTTSTGTRRRTPCGRITATFTEFHGRLFEFRPKNCRFESGNGWMITHSAFSKDKKQNRHQLLVSFLLRFIISGGFLALRGIRNSDFCGSWSADPYQIWYGSGTRSFYW